MAHHYQFKIVAARCVGSSASVDESGDHVGFDEVGVWISGVVADHHDDGQVDQLIIMMTVR